MPHSHHSVTARNRLPSSLLSRCLAGITAENVAEVFHVSRDDMDQVAAASHAKAAAARAAGKFKKEIVPVKTKWIDPNTGGLGS